jgi:hypothetical protein
VAPSFGQINSVFPQDASDRRINDFRPAAHVIAAAQISDMILAQSGGDALVAGDHSRDRGVAAFRSDTFK